MKGLLACGLLELYCGTVSPPPPPISLFQQNEAIKPSFNSLLKSSNQALQQQTQTFKSTKILQTCFYIKLNEHTQSIQLDFLIFCKAKFCSILFSYKESKLTLSLSPTFIIPPSLLHILIHSLFLYFIDTHPPTKIHTHPHKHRAWHKREISRYYKGKQAKHLQIFPRFEQLPVHQSNKF